jgi:hypothetical protein
MAFLLLLLVLPVGGATSAAGCASSSWESHYCTDQLHLPLLLPLD